MLPRLSAPRPLSSMNATSSCIRSQQKAFLSAEKLYYALSNFAAHKEDSRQPQLLKVGYRLLLHQQCSPHPHVISRSFTPHKRFFHSSSPSHAPPKNPYEVLGIKKDAGVSEIKKAYYQLAKQYHPDTNKNKGAHERFVEIQAAYDLLSDEKKRAAYDRYGAASQQEGFDPNAFAQGFSARGFGFQDFGGQPFAGGARGQADLFETLFGAFAGSGGRGRDNGHYRGDDIEASVNISFLEACKGTTRPVTISPVIDCKTCSGSGLKPGAKRSTCTACGGSGSRTFVIESGFQMTSTCPTCQGAGTTVPRSSQCGDCSGMGKVKIRKDVQVDIPPGVEDGMSIRVTQAGDAPISGRGSPGDLLVRIHVATSKAFRRQGRNLYHDARIPMHTAILGGKVRVPTLEGEVDVRVPPGSQPGEECVLKRRGVPDISGGGRGDLFVAFQVQLPRSLTPRQRHLIQQYVDDVEGRANESDSTTEQKTANEETKQSKDNSHGTNSFSPRASSLNDWLSRAWNRMKKLMPS